MRLICRPLVALAVCPLALVGSAGAVTLVPAIDFQSQGNASGFVSGQSSGPTLNFRFVQTPRTDNRFGMEFPLASIPATNVVASATWRGTPASVSGSSSLLSFYGYDGNGTFQQTDTYDETSPLGQLVGVAVGSEYALEFDPGYISSLVGTATHFGVNARELETGAMGTFASRSTAMPPTLELVLIDPLAANSNHFQASGTQFWSVDGNWSLGTPIASDDIFIRPAAPTAVFGPDGHVEVNTFALGGAGSAQAEFIVGDGVDFESQGITTLGSGGILRLGNGSFRTAGLNSAPGGIIDWGTNGFLAIDDGYLSTPVGDFTVDGADMPILAMVGGKMRKSTSGVPVPDRLVVGDDQSGLMVVSGQSVVQARLVRVGNQASGFGRIVVGENGTLFQPSALMEVGSVGRGQVEILLGARMEAGLVFVGATLQGAIDNDDVDQLVISDPGTTARASRIESSGRSIVEIKNGAVVEAGAIAGAGDPLQPPVFRVAGAGTRLTLSDRIQMGSTLMTNASSQIFVEDGARVDTGRLILGVGIAPTGISRSSMVIRGVGTQVNTSSFVLLGGERDSESSLELLDGAILRAGMATGLSYTTAPVPANTISTVRVSGAGTRWEQTGELSVGGLRDLLGVLADLGTSTLTIENDATLDATQAVNVMLRGTLNFTGGRIQAPVLRNDRGGAFNFTGGTLAVGQFDGDLEQQGGTLAAGTSPGTLTINGDYTLDGSGTLEVELAAAATPGTGYDQYVVSGDATLAGRLRVELLEDFLPTLGDSFIFLTAAGTLSSTFDELQLPQLSSGLAWQLTPGEHSLVLDVVVGALDGDFNHDNTVDAADYTVWRDGLGSVYTEEDYLTWKTHFGEMGGAGGQLEATTASVPEPITIWMAMLAAASLAMGRTARVHVTVAK